MKCWPLLFVLGFSFASCIKGDREDLISLRSHLVMPVEDISAYITGIQKEVKPCGEIVAIPCEKNFAKAHALFQDVERRLQEYPKIINCSIAQTILSEISELLSKLGPDIENLADGQDKNQFNKELHQLNAYVSSLMRKNVQ